MSDELLNNPAHKLQAVLNHTLTDSDKELPPAYVAACWRWFSALSGDDQVIAAVARAAYDKGDEGEAVKAAAALPPAPVCPLL
jgi:hypothetical protein